MKFAEKKKGGKPALSQKINGNKAARRLAAVALNEEFHTAIVGPLCILVEVTAGKLVSLTMVMQTFATQTVFVASVRASTEFFIHFSPRALVFLVH